MRIKDYNKIDAIYKAALELISHEGIAGLTMSKLAKKAGLATGTLYIYFKNKEEVFTQLYTVLRDKSKERFMKGYDPNESFQKGFKKVWLNYLKHRLEHYEESVFLEQFYRSPYITPEQRTKFESMKNPVLDLIRRGKEEQVLKIDVDAKLHLIALLGIIRELVDDHMMHYYKLDEDRIEKAYQLCWNMSKS